MSNMVTSVSALMRRWAGQSLCIATARLRNLPPNNVINTLVETTLSKKEVIEQVEEYFN